MIDLKFLRENPDIVKQNIKNKFQDDKLPLVDQVIELDAAARAAQQEADELRAAKNKNAKEIGALMAQGKKEEAEAKKAEVKANKDRLEELEAQEKDLKAKVREIMLVIPNIIDPSVPIGKDDSENVEITRYGDPVVPDFEIPYHAEIMESFDGLDIDAAGKVAGNGFYYLMGPTLWGCGRSVIPPCSLTMHRRGARLPRLAICSALKRRSKEVPDQ